MLLYGFEKFNLFSWIKIVKNMHEMFFKKKIKFFAIDRQDLRNYLIYFCEVHFLTILNDVRTTSGKGIMTIVKFFNHEKYYSLYFL